MQDGPYLFMQLCAQHFDPIRSPERALAARIRTPQRPCFCPLDALMLQLVQLPLAGNSSRHLPYRFPIYLKFSDFDRFSAKAKTRLLSKTYYEPMSSTFR
jgi:hypothetical protein